MSWTRRHQPILGGIFIAVMAVAILFDLYLVLVLRVDSISWRTWVQTKKHPTLIVAGVFATVGVCWSLRGDWRLVMFAAFMGGHLFAHF